MGTHTNGIDFWNVGSVYLDNHYHIQVERTLLDDYSIALYGIVNVGGTYLISSEVLAAFLGEKFQFFKEANFQSSGLLLTSCLRPS
jgi:hypothetical protein